LRIISLRVCAHSPTTASRSSTVGAELSAIFDGPSSIFRRGIPRPLRPMWSRCVPARLFECANSKPPHRRVGAMTPAQKSPAACLARPKAADRRTSRRLLPLISAQPPRLVVHMFLPRFARPLHHAVGQTSTRLASRACIAVRTQRRE
jgi:hypothetical protein